MKYSSILISLVFIGLVLIRIPSANAIDNMDCQVLEKLSVDINSSLTDTDENIPSNIRMIEVESNDGYSVGLADNGTVWGWNNLGSNNSQEHTSLDKQKCMMQFRDDQGNGYFQHAVAVDIGESHIIILKSDGTVWMIGKNEIGQMGDGTVENRVKAVQVVINSSNNPLNNIIAISAGDKFNIALKNDGTVWSLGRYDFGEHGDDPTSEKLSAFPVKLNDGTLLSHVIAISADGENAAARKTDGTVWTWGEIGQLHEPFNLYPVKVKGSELVFERNVSELETLKNDIPVSEELIVQSPPVKEYHYTNDRLTSVEITMGSLKYRQVYSYDLNGNLESVVTTQVQ